MNAAKECIVDDIDRALHDDILNTWVKTIENDASLKEADIAGFLMEDNHPSPSCHNIVGNSAKGDYDD